MLIRVLIAAVKVRLQSQPTDRPPTFTGPLDCFRQTWGREGWKGLYRVRATRVESGKPEGVTHLLSLAGRLRATRRRCVRERMLVPHV